MLIPNGVEISLYGKRPSLVSRAGTVPGERVGQDGYVVPRKSFSTMDVRVITSLSQIRLAHRVFCNGGR